MQPVVLLAVAAVWAAVIIPPLLRSRVENREHGVKPGTSLGLQAAIGELQNSGNNGVHQAGGNANPISSIIVNMRRISVD